jgi:DTW domain-containing protein YfiP
MPLVDLCVFGSIDSGDTTTETQECEEDFVMKTIVGRGLGPDGHADVINHLIDPNQVIVLVFPGQDVMDFEEGIQLAEMRCCVDAKNDDAADSATEHKKMTLLFIDATWKHAREMEAKLRKSLDCKHWIRVQLVPTALEESNSDHQVGLNDDGVAISNHDNTNNSNQETPFIPRRFEIRAPPSPNHLSTAECLAWVASRVERNPDIFESITKVLDYMVHLWKVNVSSGKKRKDVMSQKSLGIRSKGSKAISSSGGCDGSK